MLKEVCFFKFKNHIWLQCLILKIMLCRVKNLFFFYKAKTVKTLKVCILRVGVLELYCQFE